MTTELAQQQPQAAELATVSSAVFLKRYSVAAVQRELRKTQTAIACATSCTPVLATMRKMYGERWTAAYIALWIVNVQDFFNVSGKMNDAQVEETAYMILDDFWALNVADIHLVFSRAKKGYYGQLYGRIDGSLIYDWFRSYFEERCDACENRTIRQSENARSDNPVTDDRATEFIQKLIQNKRIDHEAR